MLNKIVDLTKELISIKSNSGSIAELDRILDVVQSRLYGFNIERFENKGVKSILIYSGKKRPPKFKVILNGHLDVVPGKDYQYLPKIKDNRLYGVGAMDMKASVACLVMVFKEVVKKVNYPLALQLVTDEEIGGFNGTKYQIDNGVRADFIIAGETTGLNIVNQAKGILWVKISSSGKTAHGAYPWDGDNAIWNMTLFLTRLKEKYPNPRKKKWVTTVNLSRIETNNKIFNKIPDNCEVWLDIRYIPEDTNTIVNSIKELLPKGFKMVIVEREPAMLVNGSNFYIKRLQQIGKNVTKKKIILYGAQGSSDARHYVPVNGAGIEFGPRGGGIGSDNEWVDISSLEKYSQILIEFLISLSV